MAFHSNDIEAADERLRAHIIELGIPLGGRLPGEKQLESALGVSRHLIKLMLKRLQRDGILERRGRSGSYLIRPPEKGAVPVGARAQAPVKSNNRTLSLMAVTPHPRGIARLQETALARQFLLHTYFAVEHASSPADEQMYLQQAVDNAYRGAVVHPTPLEPRNDEFFRRIASNLRLAHINWHSADFPEQSFFLPDYRGAGLLAVARLAALGCRRVIFSSIMHLKHHITRLIGDGLAAGCAAAGMPPPPERWNMELDGRFFDPQTGEVARLLDEKPDVGLVFYGLNAMNHFLAAWASAPERLARLGMIHINEDLPETPHPIDTLSFDWLARATDALDFVMDESEHCVHRLYLPTLQPAGRKTL